MKYVVKFHYSIALEMLRKREIDVAILVRRKTPHSVYVIWARRADRKLVEFIHQNIAKQVVSPYADENESPLTRFHPACPTSYQDVLDKLKEKFQELEKVV